MGISAPEGGATSATGIPIFRTEDRRTRLRAIYHEKLRRWPVPFETSFVPTRYGMTHVIAGGPETAPPLVLLHQAGVAGFVWSSIVPALDEHHRWWALDTIGDVGRSELDDPGHHPKRGRDYSAWLDDVYQQLGIATADLGAGSFGGWIALHHAADAPQRVGRLVLLGPMGLPPWWATLRIAGPITSLALRPTDAKLDALLRRAIGDGGRVNDELHDWLRIVGKCRPLIGKPLPVPGAKLRMIRSPTLVFLGGKYGAIGSMATAARRARRNIDRCAVEILPEAGHMMSIDEPDHVGGRIAEFLRSSADRA